MTEVHEGGCLCGSVRYRVVGEPMLAGVCHCKLCQRGTGSAFREVAYFEEVAVQISGALKAYEYRSDEIDRWIRTEFCPTCGTTVTWTAEYIPGARGIAQGTLDEPNWIKHQWHAWTRSAQHWIAFPANVELIETRRPV